MPSSNTVSRFRSRKPTYICAVCRNPPASLKTNSPCRSKQLRCSRLCSWMDCMSRECRDARSDPVQDERYIAMEHTTARMQEVESCREQLPMDVRRDCFRIAQTINPSPISPEQPQQCLPSATQSSPYHYADDIPACHYQYPAHQSPVDAGYQSIPCH